jgi:hypothetical protein
MVQRSGKHDSMQILFPSRLEWTLLTSRRSGQIEDGHTIPRRLFCIYQVLALAASIRTFSSTCLCHMAFDTYMSSEY